MGDAMKQRFTFTPANILRGFGGPYRCEAVGAWQWFVQQLAESGAKGSYGYIPYEWINGTSSINNSRPDPFGCEEFWEEPNRRMRQLLLCAGQRNSIGNFLKRKCGIPSWASLERKIFANVKTCLEFPNEDWFGMSGRTFRRSPNSCRAGATFVHDARLELDGDGKLWSLSVEYGYPHDSSSWFWRVKQEDGERLDAFAKRVEDEIDNAMEPDPEPSKRRYLARMWGETYAGLRGVFYDEGMKCIGWENLLADSINHISALGLAQSRIPLTPQRMAVLKRWAKGEMK